MAKKFRIDYAEVELDVDSYENGELDYYTTYDYSYFLKDETFNTLKELVSAVIGYFEDGIFSADPLSWVYIDGRLDTDATVGVEDDVIYKPSTDDLAAWKVNDAVLYVAHLFVGVSVYEEEHTLTAAEAEAEGFSEY